MIFPVCTPFDFLADMYVFLELFICRLCYKYFTMYPKVLIRIHEVCFRLHLEVPKKTFSNKLMHKYMPANFL